ncbi:MAG: MobC family plasmid mobilization relaxosome protein [bacterium]|nr:MobC family plasmid mobilization relaxosome protein [bacterium]
MARPNTKSPRSEAFRVRLKAEEKRGLLQLAKTLGQTPSRIVRRAIHEAVTAGPLFFDDGLQELRQAHRQLAAVGRNVNQLAKAANREDPIVPSALARELEAVSARVTEVARWYQAAIERATRRGEQIREGRGV